mmetsp:Transcript_41964/g.82413  ORF Transcript_41964/g.82413 Transcript_41964/m.82413 type:complete len:259 (-) Transcript_41964:803-1579(-)
MDHSCHGEGSAHPAPQRCLEELSLDDVDHCGRQYDGTHQETLAHGDDTRDGDVLLLEPMVQEHSLDRGTSGFQRRRDGLQRPSSQGRHKPHTNSHAKALSGRGPPFKSPRGHDHTHPEQDAHCDLHWHQAQHQTPAVDQAQHQHRNSVSCSVHRLRAHTFVHRVPDEDAPWERVAQKRAQHVQSTGNKQRGQHRECVAGCFCGFDVDKVAHEVEDGHRQDDRDVAPAGGGEQSTEHCTRGQGREDVEAVLLGVLWPIP